MGETIKTIFRTNFTEHDDRMKGGCSQLKYRRSFSIPLQGDG